LAKIAENPAMSTPIYLPDAPSLAAVQGMPGLTLLEFGVDWCGHCRAAFAPVTEALSAHPTWRHWRVEDGPGRALGRAYGVKLWPTLIFLVDGQERARLVRPTAVADVAQALQGVQAM
jgi:thioredoxin 1